MTTLLFNGDLKDYQNVVVLYRTKEGDLYLSSTSYYNGRGRGADYMSVIYQSKLNDENGMMEGWNELDENGNGRLVPENDPETAVEDFLYAHGLKRSWRSVPYVEVDSYPEMEKIFAQKPMEIGEVRAYVMK